MNKNLRPAAAAAAAAAYEPVQKHKVTHSMLGDLIILNQSQIFYNNNAQTVSKLWSIIV